MKYKVSFSVTDTYPAAEIEAKDRDEAIAFYQKLWKDGNLGLADLGIEKNAQFSVVSVW